MITISASSQASSGRVKIYRHVRYEVMYQARSRTLSDSCERDYRSGGSSSLCNSVTSYSDFAAVVKIN